MSANLDEIVRSMDLEDWAKTITEVTEQSQKLVQSFTQQTVCKDLDPFNLGQAFFEVWANMAANPMALANSKMSLWNDYLNLWNNTARRMWGLDAEPVVEPEPDDKRFKDEEWEEHFVFDFIKQSYLLAANWVQSQVADVEGVDEKTKAKAEFFTRQFVDAMAPTNFLLSNPKVLRETVDSRGQNLVKGLQHILADLEAGEGRLQIRMTDLDAFELGKNVATTPGSVVYQNEMMQLLQYTPTTKKVYERPLLIIPPWINKFYILDLQPTNSFIKWAVDRGHTVFVISWVNPDEELATKSFDDYMLQGPLEALDQIKKATGEKSVNAIGYCLGGTLLAATLAYMAAKKDKRIASATFFTTMIDFAEPGDLGVFIDDQLIASLEKEMDEKGYLEGSSMATTFNMLRSNDLIWSFVINNYLLGKEPFAFDLLYWNSDSTRMPATMHSYYLRNMYQKDLLKEPGGISLDGVAIDLSKVKTPSYFLSTREDHIAPWKSTYAGAQLLNGPTRFVLGGSGHIAGVINPPAANKYGFWTNGAKREVSAAQWLKSAKQHEGSWWSDWDKWVAKYAGEQVPARKPGDHKLKVLEPAPGSYVKVRASEA